jgi:predicted dehydrogenase
MPLRTLRLMSEIRVGIVGTSWWTDAMYLPALASHPSGSVRAICGRNRDTADHIAKRWGIPLVFTDWEEMLASGEIDAVIIATPNDTHHPITMAALARRLPVLCEKPIALTVEQAREMAAAAEEADVTTMVPFSYRFMPTNQYVKRLITEGYIGKAHHLHLRYFTGYARGGEYAWRFDTALAGAGIVGDLGAHWLDMARWFFGEIVAVSATIDRFVDRAPRPDGTPYDQAEDSAVILTRFESGALGVLHTTAVCWEPSKFGQTHGLDIHGTDGTLHAFNDWDTVQEVRGVRHNETGAPHPLTIPDDVWQGAPTETVHDTYRHMFRRTEAMTRGWLTAVGEGRKVDPDLATGARIQELMHGVMQSAAANSTWVEC